MVSLAGLKLFDNVPGKYKPFSSINLLFDEKPRLLNLFEIFFKDEIIFTSFEFSKILTGPETFITISPFIDLLEKVLSIILFLFFIIYFPNNIIIRINERLINKN